MNETLYATFSDATQAEKAAGALLDYGVRKDDISVVADTRNYKSSLDPGDHDEDEIGEEYAMAAHAERTAKSGITTTTPGDAGLGAAKGAGVGLGIGVLAGVASLIIPGVGLVYGGGALATAIGAAMGATAAGAVAGGVTGYLREQGVPDDAAQDYDRHIANGGAVLAVRIPSGPVDEDTVRHTVAKYHTSEIEVY